MGFIVGVSRLRFVFGRARVRVIDTRCPVLWEETAAQCYVSFVSTADYGGVGLMFPGDLRLFSDRLQRLPPPCVPVCAR